MNNNTVMCLSCSKNMKNVTSLLLMLVMLGVFIKTSPAIRCYKCEGCDEVTPDTGYCLDDICVTHVMSQGVFRNICV